MEYRSSPAKTPSRIPIALVFAIGFAVVTGMSAGRELYRRNRVQGEVQALEVRVSDLEKRKQSIAQILEKIQSPEVLDREARLRLNMQRPGERVYVLRGDNWEEVSDASALPALYEAKTDVQPRSNPQRWLQFFLYPAA